MRAYLHRVILFVEYLILAGIIIFIVAIINSWRIRVAVFDSRNKIEEFTNLNLAKANRLEAYRIGQLVGNVQWVRFEVASNEFDSFVSDNDLDGKLRPASLEIEKAVYKNRIELGSLHITNWMQSSFVPILAYNNYDETSGVSVSMLIGRENPEYSFLTVYLRRSR